MRKSKTIKIDDKEITVKELTVQHILDIVQDAGEKSPSLTEMKDLLNKHLDKVTDLSFEDFRKMAPSEIRQVWATFKDVNDAFFEVSASLGLTGLAVQMRESFIKDWSKLALNLLSPGTRMP